MGYVVLEFQVKCIFTMQTIQYELLQYQDIVRYFLKFILSNYVMKKD